MKILKKILKVLLIVILALVLIAGAYVAYVFIAYHRVPDRQELEVRDRQEEKAETGREYRLLSFNIGFGAYEADFGFFMDGGTESWAWSKDRLRANMEAITELVKKEAADFTILQEVDSDSTRTYHTDERAYFYDALTGQNAVYAANWDSPFLFYPITQPHGFARTGIMTFSPYRMDSGLRRSLPVESGFMKIIDLDRCYTVSRFPLADGHEMVLYNVHLSAYTSDGKIAEDQLKMMLADMKAEYEQGNYCIAGGDLNKDLSGDAARYFGTDPGDYNWAQPIPESLFEGTHVSLVFPYNEETKVPSCRNADGPYHKGQYVLTVDGFLVTENVEVLEADVIDTGYRYSDHNPIFLRFSLKN